MTSLVTALLAWGVLAFGAVYAWAAEPLAIAIAGLAIWQVRRGVRIQSAAIIASLTLLFVAGAIQIVPMSKANLSELSLGAVRFLSVFDIRFSSGVATAHGLSVDPRETQRGLMFLAVLVTWVATCMSVLRTPGRSETLARNIVALGGVVGLVGLAQKATFNGKLLWFWTPDFYSWNSFGPFVNRNHFAGWMLLAMAVSVGSLFGRLSTLKMRAIHSWRDRVLWLDSADAAPIILTSAAVLVMAISIVWTMSRSGIGGAGVALTMLIGAAAYRANGHVQRFVLVGYCLFALAAVVAWRGADTIFNWYGDTTTLAWRIDLWKDTMRPLKDFWLTGSGFNTYGTVMLVYPRTDMTVHPVQAHNDYLQLAVEGGLLVCIPVLLLIIAVAREALKRLNQTQDDMTWWIRMGAIAGMCGIAVQELTDFSLQIPGVALLFATCVGIALHASAPLDTRKSRRTTPHAQRVLQTVS